MFKSTFLIIINSCILSVFVFSILLTSVLHIQSTGNFMPIVYTVCMVLYALTSVLGAFFISKQKTMYKLPAALLSLGLLCTATGELFWIYFELIRGVTIPYPSLADVWFVLFYPIVFMALSILLLHLAAIADQYKWLINLFKITTVIFVIVGVVLSVALYRPDYVPDSFAYLSGTFDLLYVLCDALLLVHIITLIFFVAFSSQKNPHMLSTMFLLGIGMLILLIADSLFAYTSEVGLYQSGGYVDFLFMLSSYFISVTVAKLLKLSLAN